jgi:hypothetical protein
MSTRKVFFISLVSNVLILSALAGAFVFTRTAQANTPGAPATSNPQAPTIGPYFQMFSGADFVPYRFDFAITRDNYAVVRQSAFGIGVVGLHLPPGATITELLNDTDDSDGATDVLLLSCPLLTVNCTELGRATQNQPGRNVRTLGLSVAVDSANNAYFLQVNLQNNSKFYFARVAYSLPSGALYMPAISR